MHLLNLGSLFSLLFLATNILAVDISFYAPNPLYPNVSPRITYRCPGIPPGHCCKPRPDNPQAIRLPTGGQLYLASPPNKRITFTGLEPLHIASAWVNRSAIGGCYGLPKATYAGGGTWQYDVPEGETDQIMRGGNYFTVPIGVPEYKDKGWLNGEGVLGFVWGTGDWFGEVPSQTAWASLRSAARSQLGGSFPSDLRSWPGSKKMRKRGNSAILQRGLQRKPIMTKDNGIVFCKSPEQTRWPDVITIDGVDYRTQTPQSDIYLSQDGKLLNYTGT